MNARDDYPPADLLSGWAALYDRLWNEIDRLRAEATFEFRKTFGRFKYAEEFVQTVEADGVTHWRLSRAPDMTVEEDGETYINKVYVVEWTRHP